MAINVNSKFVRNFVALAATASVGAVALPAVADMHSAPMPEVEAIPEAVEVPGEVPSATDMMPTEEMPGTIDAMPTEEMPGTVDAMPTETDPVAAESTVVELAAENGSFQTLVAAIQEAGLAETLSGEGPFTVFAPTDEAFAALPEGTVEQLLLPENRDLLVQILTYHVVPGRITSDELMSGEVATVEGSSVMVAVDEGVVAINDANVTEADIAASNGVIHVIDRVILPPALLQ